MISKKWDIVICLVLSAIVGVFALELREITPVARVYPMCIIIGCYVMIAIILVQSLAGIKKAKDINAEKMEKSPSGEMPLSKKTIARILIYCTAILAYILLIQILGYIISTIIFAVFSLVYQKNRSKLVVVIFPIAVTLIMYFVFSKFLFVTLPAGSLFETLL